MERKTLDVVWLWEVERRILQGCVYFLDRRYLIDEEVDHVMLQNMICFLQIKGWITTDYEFRFNGSNGMYSTELEPLLNLMDRKKDEIRRYQSDEQYFEELPLKDWRRINSFFEQYMQQHWNYSVGEWMKALAMCLYIKTFVYPSSYVPVPMVVKRLQQEDPALNMWLIEKAWSVL